MQAAGLVNDHTLGCFRRTQVAAVGETDGQKAAEQDGDDASRTGRLAEPVAQPAPAEQHVGGQHRQPRLDLRSGVSSALTPSRSAVAA